jgi:hypothetical protein
VRRPVALLTACLLLVAGCGSESESRPQVGVKGDEEEAARDLGFPAFATKNTTRVGGADAIANAAAVSRAVYPGVESDERVKVVVLVDAEDWRAGIAASALVAEPIGGTILMAEGDELPPATRDALRALAPTGSDEAGAAQVIRVGDVPKPEDVKTTDVSARGGAPALADALDRFLAAARGRTTDRVVVVGGDRPDFAMPAAGWAAKSGDPVLYVERDAVPEATKTALKRHQQPRILLLGPEAAVSSKVETELKRLGDVTRVEGADPVENAIAFARYSAGDFGWGVTDPGHGLVFVNVKRPADAVAASPLSSSGKYGPILLHDGKSRLPGPLSGYLQDIRPGYRRDPVRGVYNHGWIIGDEAALPIATQAEIDSLLEIAEIDPEATSTDSP